MFHSCIFPGGSVSTQLHSDPRPRRALPFRPRYASRQHSPSRCIDGQGTLPYEQKTQQSPDFGRSTVSHAGHVQKNWQLSVGMVAVVSVSHAGHVTVDVRSRLVIVWRRFGDGTEIQRSSWLGLDRRR